MYGTKMGNMTQSGGMDTMPKQPYSPYGGLSSKKRTKRNAMGNGMGKGMKKMGMKKGMKY